jgi:hypothetical protein
MYNDYIAHRDHKYLARVKDAANRYRYFYTQAAYNTYKNAKAIGAGLITASKLSYNRKKLASTSRRTDVFSQWDKARREEYANNVANAVGPGAAQTAVNNWNDMISDFGNTLWKKKVELLAQPTDSTMAAYEGGRTKESYRIRPRARKKNVTGNANPGSTAKKPLATVQKRRSRR